MTTDLEALRERLEKADGPDRKIDRDLWEALTGECTHRTTHYVYLENDERELACSDCGADTYGSDKWSGITRSLDAALSLAERVLPEAHWSVSNAAVKPRANVWMPQPTRPIMGPYSSGVTPALALCLAIVKAKIAEEDNAY